MKAPGKRELWRLDAVQIGEVVAGRHKDPFAVLGPQRLRRTWFTRTFLPGAEEVAAETLDGTRVGTLDRRSEAGFFEGKLALKKREVLRYVARRDGDTWTVVDPYSFEPVLGPMDDYYTSEGTHLRLFDKLGAHVMTHEGVGGVNFAVWAPNATRVSVVGDFNAWDGRRHVMRHRFTSGVWEIFVPDIGAGAIYKFEIVDADGNLQPLKADPFAFRAELRPGTASIVAEPGPFEWHDAEFLGKRQTREARHAPISVYEVHLGSWRRHDDGAFLTYDQLAETLIPYAADLGFTHLELLPIMEHPLDASWGYQPTALFAPTARFGDPAGFARFVDRAHSAGLGVILDWVPAHFPTDAHGLHHFDGTPLYEHADARQGFHPDWKTAIYNFGRTEVSQFLINSALFWLERFHVDGLRVDAVASMLYLDYSRKPGEWLPNRKGGNENLEAVAFLQRLNTAVYGRDAGAMTMAEESTAWPGVSTPVHAGGLGFGFKWNMGFMHDTLRYLQRESVHRRFHHSDVTFGLLYAFAENFVLPLSHDEVVHGKGSLISKLAGDTWQKFATLRAYYAFMWGYPGKKLLFMGQEFAVWDEWDEARGLDWHLAGEPAHAGVQKLLRDLNRAYREMTALHARDCEAEGFAWLEVHDSANSVFAWQRRAPDKPPVVVVSNFTPVQRTGYILPMPYPGRWREIINTDASDYGGSGEGNLGVVVARESGARDREAVAEVTLPPLATLYFAPEG